MLNNFVLYTKNGCPHCVQVKAFLKARGLDSQVSVVNVEEDPGFSVEGLLGMVSASVEKYGTPESRSMPMLFDESGDVPKLVSFGYRPAQLTSIFG